VDPSDPSARRPGSRCCATDLASSLSGSEVDSLITRLEILAHPIRLQLLAVLAGDVGGDGVCVCDLEAMVPVKQPTVSHHLSVLRRAGLARVERRGLWAYYFVEREALEALGASVAEGLGRLAGAGIEADVARGSRTMRR
jgi:ArsR family transcriptional regulator